ncbi:MAG: hypothetical protein IPG96_20110 [Proteobacteria bacterium]|nr:hypothetical protein [Pseudomonadota bacterium]
MACLLAASTGPVLGLLVSVLPSSTACAARAAPPPPGLVLRDGDLVFQTSLSGQGEAVALATGSRYTHMGVVLLLGGRPVVLEAVQPVQLTPWPEWLERGDRGHVVVKRLVDVEERLTPAARARMHALANKWIGRRYDPYFRWDDDRLYCSELVYKLYQRAVGLSVGVLRRAGDFNLASAPVRRLMRRRFGGAAGRFDPREPAIAPQQLFAAPGLVTIFSN